MQHISSCRYNFVSIRIPQGIRETQDAMFDVRMHKQESWFEAAVVPIACLQVRMDSKTHTYHTLTNQYRAFTSGIGACSN